MKIDAGISVRPAASTDLDAVLALYARGGYGGGVGADDTVLVVVAAGAVVGVVRLCPEHGVTVLCGMQVEQGWRRRGAGRLLLAACAAVLGDRPAYCLPYAHLRGFYALAGFEPACEDALPAFLRARLDGYRALWQAVLAMLRAGAA